VTARRLRDLATRLVPPLCAALVLLAIWELWVRWTDPPRFLFCAPSEIWRDATARAGELAMAMWNTTVAVAWGFALSAVVGVAAGVILSSNRVLERALYPFTVVLQTVPLVAIAPLLVIWLHAGVQAVAVCAFIVSLFPVITNTLSGIRSIPSPQVELFSLYGARPWALLFKLKLPGAVPTIMAGLRVAAGLAVIGAVVGEFVAGELGAERGLGIVVVVAAKQGDLPMLFAAVALASLLGIAMVGGVNAAAYLLMYRWHVSQRPD
jgi:NitT/TauT family transport system permease protein